MSELIRFACYFYVRYFEHHNFFTQIRRWMASFPTTQAHQCVIQVRVSFSKLELRRRSVVESLKLALTTYSYIYNIIIYIYITVVSLAQSCTETSHLKGKISIHFYWYKICSCGNVIVMFGRPKSTSFFILVKLFSVQELYVTWYM